MAETKHSTLPHVLKEYNPEYEPKSLSRHPSVHRCYTDLQDKGRQTTHSGPGNVRAKTTLSEKKPKERTSSRRGRKTDDERYEELSEKWDKAKHGVRQEDHEYLKEKIALQQELIKRQDEYAQQRRVQIAEQEHQQREAEKAKKAEKEEKYRQICKQSLKEDKKSLKEGKKATKSGKDLTSQKDEDSSMSTEPPRTPKSGSGHRSAGFKPALPAMTATPDLPRDDNEVNEKEMKVPEDALWHEQQLYKLYGKNADYFLHPKMEAQSETVKKTNPKLRRHGEDLLESYWNAYEDGRAGAEVLWQTLRNDSNIRLMKEDAGISKELKVPEMNKLLDNRQLMKIRKQRHKSDLMYRASVSNQDRTEVITFNNPLPEFHDPKPESINRYLPSWQDDESVSTQPEYAKWIKPGQQARDSTIQEESGESPRQLQTTQSFDEDLILILSRKKRPTEKPKYVFLSEKDATVKGEFSEKFKDERENKDIPPPYQGDRPKAYSSMAMRMVSASPDQKTASCYSAPILTRDELLKQYTSDWQPLTMHALVEYKKQVNTVGEGEFNLGRTKMWSNIPILEKT